MKSKIAIFSAVVPVTLALDWITKRWALDALAGGRQLELLGGLVPLTLAFNKGAAFGIGIGEDSRWLFVPITFVALVLLALLLHQAEEDDRIRHLSLALVMAGALGNLYDRLRWDRGVVDFIGPLDLLITDFPIFNVADMSISCGAVLLAWSFWMEERRIRAREAEATASTESGASTP